MTAGNAARTTENKNFYSQRKRITAKLGNPRIAKTPEEVSALTEAGFEYVTDLEGMKFFRKRK